MYLLNDLRLREQVALIAMDLSSPIDRILAQKPLKAPQHTTFSGDGTVSYNTIPASDFHYVGKLTDPVVSLATGLADIFSSRPGRRVRDADLTALRVTKGAN